MVSTYSRFICNTSLLYFHVLYSMMHLLCNSRILIYSNASLPFPWLFQGGRFGLGNLQQHPHGVELVVWWFDLGELDQSDSQRPDVSLVIVRRVLHGLTHYHLWSHPEKDTKQKVKH